MTPATKKTPCRRKKRNGNADRVVTLEIICTREGLHEKAKEKEAKTTKSPSRTTFQDSPNSHVRPFSTAFQQIHVWSDRNDHRDAAYHCHILSDASIERKMDCG
jgi:hypothetical protein